MSANEDEQLWRRFRNGSESAFAELYDRYFKILYNYAAKFTPDKELVKDGIHDLFIELWESRQRLQDTTSIKFYLFRAMRNTLLDQLARKQRLVFERGDSLEGNFDFVPPYETSLISEQTGEEQKERVLKALNALTQRQKEAIFLKFYHNLSYEEIAAIMSLHVDSSYNLISKALSVLRKNITPINLLLFLIRFY